MTRRVHADYAVAERYAHENRRRKAVREVSEGALRVAAILQEEAAHRPEEFEIETPSGLYLNFVDPKPESIVLGDIAHSLSQICRFGGHCSRPYSVAEHTVRVSQKLEEMGYDVRTQMAGLHHDDAEAYLGDIPSPLKGLFGYSYRSLTRAIDEAIWQSLAKDSDEWPPTLNLWEVDDFKSEAVKLADHWALCCEASELMPSKGEGWTNTFDGWGATDPDAHRYGWTAPDAEWRYLSRHCDLKARIMGAI